VSQEEKHLTNGITYSIAEEVAKHKNVATTRTNIALGRNKTWWLEGHPVWQKDMSTVAVFFGEGIVFETYLKIIFLCDACISET